MNITFLSSVSSEVPTPSFKMLPVGKSKTTFALNLWLDSVSIIISNETLSLISSYFTPAFARSFPSIGTFSFLDTIYSPKLSDVILNPIIPP